MPNDAKFGLVVGVGLVITVAVVFFGNDERSPLRQAPSQAPTTTATETHAPANDPAADDPPANDPPANVVGPALATPASRVTSRGRVHRIQPGDTLYSIAERHYGDGERFIDIYRANRDVLQRPDVLPAGTELRIP